MAFIEWGDALSVTVDAMDSEHKELVRLINELHDAITVNKDKEVLGKVFDGLVQYTVFHFASEEQLMEDVGYPDLPKHRELHQDLVSQVGKLKEKYDSGEGDSVSVDVMEFLRDWLVNHIQGTDKKYGEFIKQKEAG